MPHWGDGLAAGSTSCSSTGPQFPAPLLGVSQLPVTPRDQMSSSDPWEHRYTCAHFDPPTEHT